MYFHTMEYDTAIKKKELELPAMPWMNLTDLNLHERNQM